MAFSGLRGASSGLLAVLKKGSRLRKRKPAKSGPPALPEPAPAIASLATLTKIINGYLDPADVTRAKAAYRFSDPAHPGQFRASGETYISPPIAVTQNCPRRKLQPETLMPALVHDRQTQHG